jgi:predicted methyltransferase
VSLTLTLAQPTTPVRLVDTAVAVPALTSHIRPGLVLAEDETRRVMEAADRAGVRAGGIFLASPLGVQIWTGAFDGANGTPGSARHLGSVDWTMDAPAKNYATAYRAMVTAEGLLVGETTASILARVLALGGLAIAGERVSVPIPPPRDPFRRR